MKNFIWLLSLMLVACNTNSDQRNTNGIPGNVKTDSLEAINEEAQRKENTPQGDTISFETAFSHFMNALQASDTAVLNQYIHPKYGLWVIEQPGAMPKMTHVNSITKFKREYQGRSFFTVAEEMQQCNLTEEQWPEFDCADMEGNKSGYAKDGCFVWKPDKFQRSGYWNYASLSDAQIKSIKEALPLVQQSVLHTHTSFEFHFGYLDGHWRLLFAKLIYPCSA